MKKLTFRRLANLILVTLTYTACNKTSTIPPVPLPNTAPVAIAGRDTTIVLPNNTILLDGTASSDAENNINIYCWELIKGSKRVPITNVTTNSSKSQARNLEKGIYFFELTVTDYGLLSSKDTIQVIAAEPASYSNAEIIFKDQPWDYSWFMEIDIDKLLSYLPPNSYFKNIFIKRDYSTEWELVTPFYQASNDNKYTYLFGNDMLGIYPNQDSLFRKINDTPDIKISY